MAALANKEQSAHGPKCSGRSREAGTEGNFRHAESANNLGKWTVSKTDNPTHRSQTYPKFPFRLLNISNQCHQDTWNLVLNSLLFTNHPSQVLGVLTGKLEGLD